MENPVQWIISIVGVIAIAYLAWDGFKRIRARRQSMLRYNLNPKKDLNAEPLPLYGNEFPNGGARVVGSNVVPSKAEQSKADAVGTHELTQGKSDDQPYLDSDIDETGKQLNASEEIARKVVESGTSEVQEGLESVDSKPLEDSVGTDYSPTAGGPLQEELENCANEASLFEQNNNNKDNSMVFKRTEPTLDESLNEAIDDFIDEQFVAPEFPNPNSRSNTQGVTGGAKAVEDQLLVEPNVAASRDATKKAAASKNSQATAEQDHYGSVKQAAEQLSNKSSNNNSKSEPLAEAFAPGETPIDIGIHVPLLMDSVEFGEVPATEQQELNFDAPAEQTLTSSEESALTTKDEPSLEDESLVATAEDDWSYEDEPLSALDDGDMDGSAAYKEKNKEKNSEEAQEEPELVVDHDDVLLMQTKEFKEQPVGEKLADRPPAEQIFVMHVIGRNGKRFQGAELLHLLLMCDLRFGEMDIFHRFEKANGQGKIQFSLSNSIEPGKFDLDTMTTMDTPGVSLFMGLPGPEDTVAAFDTMAEVAQVIARNLGGEIKDETHSVMTPQTIEHYREQIQNWNRTQLAKPQKQTA